MRLLRNVCITHGISSAIPKDLMNGQETCTVRKKTQNTVIPFFVR